MTSHVFYEAERIGTQWRGLVIDSKTFDTVLVTAHNYSDATVAICAARAMYTQRQDEVISPFLPSLAMLER